MSSCLVPIDRTEIREKIECIEESFEKHCKKHTAFFSDLKDASFIPPSSVQVPFFRKVSFNPYLTLAAATIVSLALTTLCAEKRDQGVAALTSFVGLAISLGSLWTIKQDTKRIKALSNEASYIHGLFVNLAAQYQDKNYKEISKTVKKIADFIHQCSLSDNCVLGITNTILKAKALIAYDKFLNNEEMELEDKLQNKVVNYLIQTRYVEVPRSAIIDLPEKVKSS